MACFLSCSLISAIEIAYENLSVLKWLPAERPQKAYYNLKLRHQIRNTLELVKISNGRHMFSSSYYDMTLLIALPYPPIMWRIAQKSSCKVGLNNHKLCEWFLLQMASWPSQGVVLCSLNVCKWNLRMLKITYRVNQGQMACFYGHQCAKGNLRLFACSIPFSI